MNEEIVFLKDDIEVGRCELPEHTNEAQRLRLAKGIGIDSYDQYQFFSDGSKRFDSIDAPGVHDPWGNFVSICDDFHRMMDTNIKLKWNKPDVIQDQQTG